MLKKISDLAGGDFRGRHSRAAFRQARATPGQRRVPMMGNTESRTPRHNPGRQGLFFFRRSPQRLTVSPSQLAERADFTQLDAISPDFDPLIATTEEL